MPAASHPEGPGCDVVGKPPLGMCVTRVSVRRISRGFKWTYPDTETIKPDCCIDLIAKEEVIAWGVVPMIRL